MNLYCGVAVEREWRMPVVVSNGCKLLALVSILSASAAFAIDPLPEGNSGIAARYPGDAGIAGDAEVLFVDDFESYRTVGELTTRWDQIFQSSNFRLATEAGSYYAGAKALEISVPAGSAEVANELRKVISPTQDVIYIRAHTMWHPQNSVIGSSHNSVHASANYCCAGVPADGKNKFNVSADVFRLDGSVANPGQTTVYIYHPEQRSEWGDYWYPDGRIIPFDSIRGDFGPDFVPRPNFIPVLGQWYSWEMMIKANSPGQRDGRVAIWVDGAIVADWQNVRLRDVATLKIDLVSIDMHANAQRSAPLRKYYDNVVVARSYIGPVLRDQGVKPMPPTNVRIAALSLSPGMR
jgi:hypothetical protein